MGTVTPIPRTTGVLRAVTAAISAMPWLGPSDQGMVELALEYARRIDASEDVKAAGWLGPHLANALRSLGGTPGDRKALGVDEQVRGKLAELRAARR